MPDSDMVVVCKAATRLWKVKTSGQYHDWWDDLLLTSLPPQRFHFTVGLAVLSSPWFPSPALPVFHHGAQPY